MGAKCSEVLVRGSCIHFAVTADKEPCVVDGLPTLSLYLCLYIYVCVCISVYI
jgi:hypothetical protein